MYNVYEKNAYAYYSEGGVGIMKRKIYKIKQDFILSNGNFNLLAIWIFEWMNIGV